MHMHMHLQHAKTHTSPAHTCEGGDEVGSAGIGWQSAAWSGGGDDHDDDDDDDDEMTSSTIEGDGGNADQ